MAHFNEGHEGAGPRPARVLECDRVHGRARDVAAPLVDPGPARPLCAGRSPGASRPRERPSHPARCRARIPSSGARTGAPSRRPTAKSFETARSDVHRAMPAARVRRIDETLRAHAAEELRLAIGRIGSPAYRGPSRFSRARLDRDIAVLRHRESGADARQSGSRGGAGPRPLRAFACAHRQAHGSWTGNEIEQAEPCDDDASPAAQQVCGLKRGLGVQAGQAIHVRPLFEQRIVKRHAPPDHGRIWSCDKHRAPARAMHVNRDRRGDLVRSEDDGERGSKAARHLEPSCGVVFMGISRCWDRGRETAAISLAARSRTALGTPYTGLFSFLFRTGPMRASPSS